MGYRWIGQPSAVEAASIDALTLTTRYVEDLRRSLTAHGQTPDPELEDLTEQLLARIADAVGTGSPDALARPEP